MQRKSRSAFTPQLLNFFKNTAMMGGLLFMAATRSQPTLLPRTSLATIQNEQEIKWISRNSAHAS
jgi:hypothetical protein